MPSTPSPLISSKNSRIRLGSAPSEKCRVRRHAKAPVFGLAQRLHRDIVNAVPAHRFVVLLAKPVHVDAEAQKLRRLEQPRFQLLLQQNGVGAEVDVLLPFDEGLRQLPDVRVHQRLPPGNAHDRRSALVDGAQALLQRQVLLDDLRRVLDLPAAGAGKVATEERLQHEHQRVPLPALEFLAHNVAGDCIALRQGNGHYAFSS